MTSEDLKLFINIPTLNTLRLRLRKITLADYLDVHEYSVVPEVSEYLMWRPHTCIAETRNLLKNIERRYKSGEFYDWGIEFQGHMVGTVGFTSLSVANNTGELGYVLSRRYWGRGIATEAARAVIAFGFEQLRLNRIECRYIKENKSSYRLTQRCHLKYEGCLRDAMIIKGIRRDIAISSILAGEYFDIKYADGSDRNT